MGKMSEVLKRKGRVFKIAQDSPVSQPAAAPRPPRTAAPAAQPAPRPPQPSEVPPLPEEVRQRLVALYDPFSPEAKRIDILRSQLLYPFHGDPPRTIMIASALPNEGRSLLLANLAISFARGLQQYVLVLDCHLVSPDMHRLLQVPATPGLTDYLEGSATVPEIIHWTPVDKLSVIPAGSPTTRPSEILATDKMAALVLELRQRYNDRYILIDTLPVQLGDDAAVLARLVEGIVFLVLAGVTDREVALRALRALPEEKVIGLVLNDREEAVIDAPHITEYLMGD